MLLNKGEEVFPGVMIYENVIENSQELINSALLTPEKWRDSLVSSNNILDKKIRNTKILDIPATYSNDIKWFSVSQTIWRYGDQYGQMFDAPFSNMEFLQLLHYSTEDGFYKPHSDDVPGLNRIFSSILYLNDVDDGGETYFNNFEISIKPKTGRLVIFPANYIYKHEAKTPKSNDKFCIVTWFNPIP